MEEQLVKWASLLIESKPEDLNIPSFEQFRAVINGIAYYFIPPSVLSPYNPMCGMRDILDYGRFHDQVSENLSALNDFIDTIKRAGLSFKN